MNKDNINKIYNEIAEELNISDSAFEKANNSYHALGEYLSNKITDYKVIIIPQGSMNLGTIIKPINDSDDYDLDAICIVDCNLNNSKALKDLIGKALKENQTYSKKLKEGKRCWTIEYSDSAQFHMDILPAMPNRGGNNKSIIITNNNNGIYQFKTSNPEEYAEWFKKKQKKEYDELIKRYSSEIKDLTFFKKRTTLQKTIQILKRHRDIKYANLSDEEKENKPISIIITTIVAEMYTGNETIYDLILKFVNDYTKYIEIDSNGNYVIKNPVNDKENFADKWNLYPERKVAFFKWIEELKYDLITNDFMLCNDLIDKANKLKTIFGDSIIENMMINKNSSIQKKYIKNDGVASLTNESTNIEVKDHTFYGNKLL